MPPRFRIYPRSAVPIWHQIEETVRRFITSGALSPGDPVPSVRDLAHELMINPATAAKAYQRLTEAGVLIVRRGEGTFVAPRPPAVPAAQRRRALHEAAERYAQTVAELGADPDEATAIVQALLERPIKEQRR